MILKKFKIILVQVNFLGSNMCLNPSYIKNRKYIPNKKNGGVVPPVSDMRVLYVPVGCGVCIECKKQKSRRWQIRLKDSVNDIKRS